MGLDMMMYQKIKKDEYLLEDREIAYWRKFNALHGFIIKEFANDVDDCESIPLTCDNLKTILYTLKKVIDEKTALKYLPVKSGFMFGDNCYTSHYFEDVKYSIDKLKEIISEYKNELDNDMIYYRASW